MNIYLKDGITLSEYGLSCGYIERVDTKNFFKCMYKDNGIYIVYTIPNDSHERTYYYFDKLTEARKHFNNL